MAIENASLLVNETVNQTAVSATSFPAPVEYAINIAFPRIKDLILAPAEHPEMLWTLAPMLVALVLMQLYFGRNKDESLGWNTAFGNSIALIFISSSLLRQLFIMSGEFSVWEFIKSAIYFHEPKVVIIILLFGYGILLMMISFFHWIPEGLAFFIMNGISINSTAYVVIVLVNSNNIPLDRHTFAAGFFIFLLVLIISIVLRSAIPQSRLSRLHKLERMKGIIDMQAKEVHRRAQATKIDFLRNRLDVKADKLEEKADKIKSMIKELE